jgi:hypothetical protein
MKIEEGELAYAFARESAGHGLVMSTESTSVTGNLLARAAALFASAIPDCTTLHGRKTICPRPCTPDR